MDMTGEQRIPADRETVWRALNDPEILKASIPGCQELVKETDTEMTAMAVIKVGPISARFQGKVTLSDLDPPNGYRITGEGQGGVAGHAKGGAVVRLTEDGGETILHYEVSAQVGGRLAQLGGRMIDATARSMSAAFFKKFAQEILAREAGAPAVTSPELSAQSAPPVARIAETRTAAPARSKEHQWFPAASSFVLGLLVMAVFGLYFLDPGKDRQDHLALVFVISIMLSLIQGYIVGSTNPRSAAR